MDDTPSKAALDLAVKPARYRNWQDFITHYEIDEGPYQIALAYAADLDKADKVGRMVAEWGPGTDVSWHYVCTEVRKSLIRPDPIDPDLLEAREMAKSQYWPTRDSFIEASNLILVGIRRGRELANSTSGAGLEQDRG